MIKVDISGRAIIEDGSNGIAAMREPTQAMASHPMATCYNYGPYGDKEVRRIWRAMIGAALGVPGQSTTAGESK